MLKEKKIIAVIPARGGSKGIPNKNLKLFNNKPLIGHIIEKLLQITYIDKIVVSTDSEEIINYCSNFNVTIIERSDNLSNDKATLDPVIEDVLLKENEKFDYVLTFQPTSPLINISSIKKGIEEFIKSNKNTIMTCIDARHLMWTYNEKKEYSPLYEERVNRQDLKPILKETGGIIGSKTGFLLENKTRVDPKSIFMYEIDENEGIDIDNYSDWILAEEIAKEKKIGIIVIGNKKKGLGHVFRGVSIANRLKTKPIFYLREDEELGIEKISDSNYPFRIFEDNTDLIKKLEKDKIQIVFNDTLDTEVEYMNNIKKTCNFLVTFEDLGEGSEIADLSFNALYENSIKDKKHFFGYKYLDLRDEFIYAKKNKINTRVENVLIVFGGTDPNNTTFNVFNYLKEKYHEINFTIVVGPGFQEFEKLKKEVLKYKNFKILKSVNKMSKFISETDLMISSNGRTVYEACSLGTPLMIISQNERELMHTFGKVSKTAVNLGLFSSLKKEIFLKEFNNICNNFELRKRISERMLKYDLTSGIDRIIKKTFDEFEKQERFK